MLSFYKTIPVSESQRKCGISTTRQVAKWRLLLHTLMHLRFIQFRYSIGEHVVYHGNGKLSIAMTIAMFFARRLFCVELKSFPSGDAMLYLSILNISCVVAWYNFGRPDLLIVGADENGCPIVEKRKPCFSLKRVRRIQACRENTIPQVVKYLPLWLSTGLVFHKKFWSYPCN